MFFLLLNAWIIICLIVIASKRTWTDIPPQNPMQSILVKRENILHYWIPLFWETGFMWDSREAASLIHSHSSPNIRPLQSRHVDITNQFQAMDRTVTRQFNWASIKNCERSPPVRRKGEKAWDTCLNPSKIDLEFLRTSSLLYLHKQLTTVGLWYIWYLFTFPPCETKLVIVFAPLRLTWSDTISAFNVLKYLFTHMLTRNHHTYYSHVTCFFGPRLKLHWTQRRSSKSIDLFCKG